MTSPPVLIAPPKIQLVRLSSGEAKYTWGATITELQGLDISADTMAMGLGQKDTPPATGIIAPDLLTTSTILMSDYLDQGGTNPANLALNKTLHQLTGSIMISAAKTNPSAGSYWVWAKLVDQTETDWFVFHKVTIS